ncbi:MAG: septum site-determining protein MinC [Gallionella sp.]
MTLEEPAFKIKTATHPLLQLHINTTDIEKLKRQLSLRLSQTPDFFVNTPIALELSSITKSDQPLDFSGLTRYMKELGLCAAGVVGGSERQRADAASSGLGLFSNPTVRPMPRRIDAEPSVESLIAHAQPELPGFESPPLTRDPDEKDSNRTTAPSSIRPTRIIDKPVRTGQRIYAEGANLVVLAIVNAGAEVIADGDIHIYAPMRGKAIAGAQGNEAARIFIHRLEAELLAIAGVFKVFEDGLPEEVRGKPAQVHLEGSRLHIQALPYE